MAKLKYILLFLMVASSLFAADEIPFDHFSGSALYLIRYLSDGNVLLPNGTNEVYGTDGRDADDYDVTMTESAIGLSGHYIGDFDGTSNVSDGFYQFVIFEQFGGSPADTDQPAIGYGTLHWKDFAEDFPSRQSDSTVTDALITSKHLTTDTFIDDSHITTDTLIIALHAVTDGKIDTTDSLITSSHSTTDAFVDSSHTTTDTLIIASHSTTDGKIDTTDILITNRTLLAADYFLFGSDDVAVVTLVDETTTNTDMRGTDAAATEAKQDIMQTAIDDIPTNLELNARTLSTLDYFLFGSDTVVNVDTVATLTDHTPQSGDTFAALPSNFSDLSIAVTTGIVDSNILGIDGNTTTRIVSWVDFIDNMLNETNNTVLVDIRRVNDSTIENVNGKLKVVPGSF